MCFAFRQSIDTCRNLPNVTAAFNSWVMDKMVFICISRYALVVFKLWDDARAISREDAQNAGFFSSTRLDILSNPVHRSSIDRRKGPVTFKMSSRSLYRLLKNCYNYVGNCEIYPFPGTYPAMRCSFLRFLSIASLRKKIIVPIETLRANRVDDAHQICLHFPQPVHCRGVGLE